MNDVETFDWQDHKTKKGENSQAETLCPSIDCFAFLITAAELAWSISSPPRPMERGKSMSQGKDSCIEFFF